MKKFTTLTSIFLLTTVLSACAQRIVTISTQATVGWAARKSKQVKTT